MSMNHLITARSWAAKSLVTLLAGLVLTLGTPMLAFAQAASEPAAAPAAATAPAVKPPVISEEAVDNP